MNFKRFKLNLLVLALIGASTIEQKAKAKMSEGATTAIAVSVSTIAITVIVILTTLKIRSNTQKAKVAAAVDALRLIEGSITTDGSITTANIEDVIHGLQSPAKGSSVDWETTITKSLSGTATINVDTLISKLSNSLGVEPTSLTKVIHSYSGKRSYSDSGSIQYKLIDMKTDLETAARITGIDGGKLITQAAQNDVSLSDLKNFYLEAQRTTTVSFGESLSNAQILTYKANTPEVRPATIDTATDIPDGLKNILDRNGLLEYVNTQPDLRAKIITEYFDNNTYTQIENIKKLVSKNIFILDPELTNALEATSTKSFYLYNPDKLIKLQNSTSSTPLEDLNSTVLIQAQEDGHVVSSSSPSTHVAPPPAAADLDHATPQDFYNYDQLLSDLNNLQSRINKEDSAPTGRIEILREAQKNTIPALEKQFTKKVETAQALAKKLGRNFNDDLMGKLDDDEDPYDYKEYLYTEPDPEPTAPVSLSAPTEKSGIVENYTDLPDSLQSAIESSPGLKDFYLHNEDALTALNRAYKNTSEPLSTYELQDLALTTGRSRGFSPPITPASAPDSHGGGIHTDSDSHPAAKGNSNINPSDALAELTEAAKDRIVTLSTGQLSPSQLKNITAELKTLRAVGDRISIADMDLAAKGAFNVADLNYGDKFIIDGNTYKYEAPPASEPDSDGFVEFESEGLIE